MRSNFRSYIHLPAIAFLVGSTLGLLEGAVWFFSGVATAPLPAIKLILNSYFWPGLLSGFAALPGTLKAWTRSSDPEEAKQTLSAIPVGVFVTVTALAHTYGDTGMAHILAVAASLSLGTLAVLLFKRVSAKFRMLRTAEPWNWCQAVLFSVLLITHAAQFDTGRWRWIAVLAVILTLTYLAALKFFSRKPIRGELLVPLLVLATSSLYTLPPFLFAGKIAPEQNQPNVLLITIDTLRADHLGLYGYEKARTPNLDQLAEESLVFTQSIAPATETCPSHTSILTGLYPAEHGALLNDEAAKFGPRAFVALPDILSRRGYKTATFVSGGTLSDAICGMAFRFDQFDEDFSSIGWIPKSALNVSPIRLAAQIFPALGRRIGRYERPGSQTTKEALGWLNRHHGGPFFLWIHYFDPHEPYRPPERFLPKDSVPSHSMVNGDWYGLTELQRDQIVKTPQDVEHMIDRYDAEIAATDYEIGRVLGELDRRGLKENTLVVVTSDHGETLGEHNIYFHHVSDLYDTNLKVPLLIRLPERLPAGRRVDRQTRLIDIAPTVLELLGISEPAFTPTGKSLLPLLDNSEQEPERLALTGLYPGNSLETRVWEIHSVRTESYKLIHYARWWRRYHLYPEREELFDLRSDPEELHNIINGNNPPPILPELRREVKKLIPLKKNPRRTLNKKQREQLRSLGYMN